MEVAMTKAKKQSTTARAIHRLGLTDLTANLKPGTKAPVMRNDGGGLYLRVAPGVNDRVHKTWIYRYSVGHKDHQLSLGPYPDIQPDEARQRAAELRKLRREGADPIAAKQQAIEAQKAAEKVRQAAEKLAAAQSKSFRQCAEEYIAAHRKEWTNTKYAEQWKSSLRMYVYPTLGDLRVADIDRNLIKSVLAPVWHKRTKTAKDLRTRISKVMGYAIANGAHPGPNPAAWRENLEHDFAKPNVIAPAKPHTALSYERVGAFLEALRKISSIAARALEFTVLTACRSGEVRLATWSEIDWDKRLWTIPRVRMKMRRNPWTPDHVVPLSDAAFAALKGVKGDREPDPSELIFVSARTNKALSVTALPGALEHIDRTITVHGFRSAFSDWCGDRTNIDEETREFALAHVKRGVEGRYRRQTAVEKRRELMQQWADYCAVIEGENVVSFAKPA
jgi:integrase